MPRETEIREGIVLSSEPGRAIVRLDRADGCGGCFLENLCRGRDASHLDVPLALADRENLNPGIRVKVAYESISPALAAVILFLPPLIGLLLGGSLANTMLAEGDGVFLAGTACGVSAGVAVAWAANRAVGSLAPKISLVEQSP